MAPQEIHQRTMRVFPLIGQFVVSPVYRDPPCGRILQAADGQDNEAVLQPFRANEAAVGQQPVIAEIDAEAAEAISPDDRQHDSGPTEIPRHQRQATPGDESARWGPRTSRRSGADRLRPATTAASLLGGLERWIRESSRNHLSGRVGRTRAASRLPARRHEGECPKPRGAASNPGPAAPSEAPARGQSAFAFCPFGCCPDPRTVRDGAGPTGRPFASQRDRHGLWRRPGCDVKVSILREGPTLPGGAASVRIRVSLAALSMATAFDTCANHAMAGAIASVSIATLPRTVRASFRSREFAPYRPARIEPHAAR